MRFVAPDSAGLRRFIKGNYKQLKAAIPTIPVLVRREATGADPTVIARYEFGVEKRAYVPYMNEAEIENVVN